GVWLNLMSLHENGLTRQVTRRLTYPPAAVAPVDLGLIANVLIRPHASQPIVKQVMMGTPSTEPFDKSLEQFVPAVESSLALTLNDWGDPQPIR
ncbi:MAG: hypothetical protein KJO13_06880, partial [Gammaproteobacteria bacterium]|nr:hypothetical protein [Gammaproteobacteria bacterium]